MGGSAAIEDQFSRAKLSVSDCLLINEWDTSENNFVVSNVAGGFQQGRLKPVILESSSWESNKNTVVKTESSLLRYGSY